MTSRPIGRRSLHESATFLIINNTHPVDYHTVFKNFFSVFIITFNPGFLLCLTRRRYVVKHNLITEVYLMNVMENNYMFRPVLAIISI